MGALAVFFFLAASACGARQGDGARAAGTCADRANAAFQKVRAVQDEHRSCRTDVDCGVLIAATGCFGVCEWVVARDGGVDAVSEILGELHRGTCTQYWKDGCQPIAIPCPSAGPRCKNGQCE